MPPAAAEETWIVIPAHNRREVTRRCLENLRDTGVLAAASLLVVDDGSTDGTTEAIRATVPGAVILRGNGDLWWTGGIALGMRHAVEERHAGIIVWLNDDCRPEAGTIEGLAATVGRRGGMAAAPATTPSGFTYGGVRRAGRWRLAPVVCRPGETLACDATTGNCVAIARAVVEAIGYPDARGLRHVLGDADYGLRATAAGFPCVLDGKHFCHNEDNLKNHMLSWLLSGVPLGRLWSDVLSVRSALHPRTAWTFHTRHFGPLRGFVLFAWPYVRLTAISAARLLLPRRLIERLYARRSAAWQTQRFYEGKDAAHLRSPSAD